MTARDQEEQDWKIKLMEQQTFWEKPRSFGIVVGATGTFVLALVAAVGFFSYRAGEHAPSSGTSVTINFPPGTVITTPPAKGE